MAAYGLLFLLALLISLCLTPPVRSMARWAGVLDVPDGRRRLHPAPVPKLGGVAVFIAFYACLWLVAAQTTWPTVDTASELASAMFFPSLLILALGIADDRRSVRPWVKISVQIAAGLLIYYQLNIRVETVAIPFVDSSMLGILSLPATLFWIVLITNAFNVIDGMDGLATGVAFIALTCMVFVSLEMGRAAIAIVAACLAGAVLGFLRYNFNPASIFLGDSGSLFLGFQLAVLSIVGSQKSSTAVAVAAPLFILALPLIETATSTVRRFVTGRSILQADAGHIHHQLIRLGFTPRRAAGILYLGSGVFGLTSLFLIHNRTTVGLIAVVLALVTWLAIQRLGYTEFAEINSALKRLTHQRRIIQNSIIGRKLAEDLASAACIYDAWVLLESAARQLGFSYVELRVRSRRVNGVDSSEDAIYSQRLCAREQSGPGNDTSFAVALTSAKETLGEVIFSRSSSAEPLHSELPLLISAVAQGLPPVLENRTTPVASTATRQQHDTSAISATAGHARIDAAHSAELARVARPVCRSCGSSGVHRAHSRSKVERIRKNITAKRLHECAACGWRGWVLPQTHTQDEHVLVTTYEAPDLQAIDIAIARMRYGSPPDASGVSGVTFGPLRHSNPRAVNRA